MIAVSVDTVSVPAALDTVLQIRAAGSNARCLVLWNLTASTLSLRVEGSPDGTTWSDVVSTFSLGAGLARVEKITSTNVLRILGSGGGDDRDLLVTLLDPQTDSNYIWQAPVL